MTNRTRLVPALALVLAMAAAAPALAGQLTVSTDKAFPFLERFLKLSPSEKARFRLIYSPRVNGKPIIGQKATLIESNGNRTVIPINADGYYEKTPSLAQLSDAKIAFDAPVGTKFGTSMAFLTTLKAETEYEVKDLVATVEETNGVIRRQAGPAAMLAPKMGGIAFVKAQGGVAVFADGRTKPLPQVKETPYFLHDEFPGAVKVKLTKTPTRVGFYPKKK
ncbi:hypothetical protein [Caulobacter henricii]|uniref:Uncharacterized protein n=1 Tax=Caulobacter henricii TaxID=69395 RepID=A0A0P0P0Y6_9CAUL|nr:hypothetical protein [Caulobacter henricii]ALL13820.1 hypothetical protein AQ619_11005 [Caulobacter henricii]